MRIRSPGLGAAIKVPIAQLLRRKIPNVDKLIRLKVSRTTLLVLSNEKIKQPLVIIRARVKGADRWFTRSL